MSFTTCETSVEKLVTWRINKRHLHGDNDRIPTQGKINAKLSTIISHKAIKYFKKYGMVIWLKSKYSTLTQEVSLWF